MTREPVNIRDAYEDDRFNKEVDAATGYRTKTVLCYPIIDSNDEVMAVIQLINKSTALEFSDQDEDLLCAFAGQIGMCIGARVARPSLSPCEPPFLATTPNSYPAELT